MTEPGGMIQGKGQAERMGHLLRLGERLTHGLQSAVWVAQVPKDMGCETSSEYPRFLSEGDRQGTMSLRIVEGDGLLEVGHRRRELAHREQGVRHRPVCLQAVGRVRPGQIEELRGHLMRGSQVGPYLIEPPEPK